jgi:4-hydroxy-3-methylbut-2-enyl diphosphate reductase
MSDLLVATPLRTERLALRGAVEQSTRVAATGMGPRKAHAAAAELAQRPGQALAVMGFCGALEERMRPGELVVASEVRGPDGAVACSTGPLLAAELRRRGLAARSAAIVSTERLAGHSQRARLGATGATAVDMESAWLAAGAAGRPLAVVRAVVDTPARELRRPLATVAGAMRAMLALRRAAPAVEAWADAVRSRTIVLAGPRASCAGVERAIEIVERALQSHGAPIYVRRQIVHNSHVVADLERRGAIFVEEVDEVPDGATVVFSAHGVAPTVRTAAAERRLRVIDATCPLVSKVHAEARRFAAAGFTIALVGHEDHDEIEGTIGEAPERVQIVTDADDVDSLEVEDPERVAYLTQTTLAVDDTDVVVEALRERFPKLVGPASSDICYATQNRQDAVKLIAPECDLVLVVGSENSSNSQRLVEVAERHGATARLIEDESAIEFDWLARAGSIGLTAGASAPEALVQRVLAALTSMGPAEVVERRVANETLQFKLPPEIERKGT